MEFVIQSFKGAGPVEFGMTRKRVRAALAPAEATARLSFLNKVPFDVFRSLGVRVEYGSDERCRAIEFASPAKPVFQGHQFLGLRLADVERRLSQLDPGAGLEDDELTFPNIGIGLYVPSAKKTSTAKVEGVIAFQKSYYDT